MPKQYHIEIKNEIDVKNQQEVLNRMEKLQSRIVAFQEQVIDASYHPEKKEQLEKAINELKSIVQEYNNIAVLKVQKEQQRVLETENKSKGVSNKEELLKDVLDETLSQVDNSIMGTLVKWFTKISPDPFDVETIIKQLELLSKNQETLSEINNNISEEREAISDAIKKFEQHRKDNSTQSDGMPEMIKQTIDDYTATDKNWEFSEEAKEYYDSYFKARVAQAKENAEELAKIEEERVEREEQLAEHSNQIQAESLAKRQAVKKQNEELIKTEEDFFAEQLAQRIEASDKMGNIEAQEIEFLEAKQSATLELIGVDDILVQNNKKIEQAEADSHKTRAQQWQEYAEKVSAISQQVSEITGMVTNSLSGMFSQLSASYAQELESLNGKIAAIDGEKEAALERVALTEDERKAREEELAQQKINLEYATSEEQKNKADERIATLQGELGAEDSINRDFIYLGGRKHLLYLLHEKHTLK